MENPVTPLESFRQCQLLCAKLNFAIFFLINDHVANMDKKRNLEEKRILVYNERITLK